MVDESELTAAIDQLIGYKEKLGLGKKMAASGFAVPATKTRDFQGVVNGGSRRVMRALDISDPARLEALGELLINAASNINMVEESKRNGFTPPLW